MSDYVYYYEKVNFFFKDFEVLFFDLTNLFLKKKIIKIYSKFSIEKKIKNYFYINSFSKLKKKLTTIDVVIDRTNSNLNQKIFNEVNKICVFSSSSYPNFFNHSIFNKVKHSLIFIYYSIKYKKFIYLLEKIRKFINLIFEKRINFLKKNISYVIICDDLSYFKDTNIKNNVKKIYSHYKDYEKFLIYKEKKNLFFERKYSVFLDEDIFSHPDNTELFSPFDKSQLTKLQILYFNLINNFFSNFEEVSKTKIIIAAHPKSLFNSKNNPYFGRELIKHDTIKLVSDCRFVLTHSSTSSCYAIFFNKPVFFVNGKIMFDLGFFNKILSMSLETGGNMLDIKKKNILLQTLKKNMNCSYKNYINKYFKSSKSKNISCWKTMNDNFR